VEKLVDCARKLDVNLNPVQLEQFAVYFTELVDWNNRFNLTSITGYDDVQIKHFCDSLTVVLALETFDTGENTKLIDIGAGAGFPGVPLKIVFPEISLTLLEATAKKAVFLEHLVQKLGLREVKIVNARAEDAAHAETYREKFDMVLSRAVSPLPTLVELCLPFCAVGGRFIAHKKGDISDELASAAKAIRVMGGKLRQIKKIELEELDDNRCLVVIDKVLPTPANFPRRPGMPKQSPIV
jgi:16S rRNA (guanine527-N7)-methyltransferase